MSKFKYNFFRAVFFICLFLNFSEQASAEETPYVLLISLDGFRHDYIDAYSPPNLLKFREEGSYAKELIPVYPSLTFTNHYSIITGLYPNKHGIVANNFYDPTTKKNYSLRDSEAVVNGEWYGGIPLWSQAELNAVKSACFFWPGSEAMIAGKRPTYYKKYNTDTSSQERIDAIIDWLKLPESERPHFLTLYFSLVDTAGHEYGAKSNELKGAVLAVDDAIGKLMEKIKKLPIPVNVIIVSDHGMTNIDPSKAIILSDFIDKEKVVYSESGTHVSLFLKNKKDKNSILSQLKKKLPKNVKAYSRNLIPAQWHLKSNKRVGDIFVMAEPPYTVHMNKKDKLNIGFHGYLPKHEDMHGIFLANGPNIRAKREFPKVENIHIYPMILKILNIPIPKDIDGNLIVLNSWIKK